MTIHISQTYFRRKLSEILAKVSHGGNVTIVSRLGKPIAAIIPIEMYQQLVSERLARFEIVEKIRQAQPELSSNEISKDVRIAIIRARKQASS